MTAHETLEQELRRGLHEVADGYVPAPLPGDLWSRGRAPRTVSRQSLLVAAAVALLLLGSVALVRPDVLVRPADAPRGGALPTDVHLPEGADELSVITSLPRGTKASVVMMVDEVVALVVDARTGEHHGVDLEAALGHPLDTRERPPVLALSPDGTRLAAAVIEETGRPGEERTGVSVLDLGATDVSTEWLTGGAWPIEVRDLSWSADSGTLAWWGNEYEPTVGPRSQDWVGTVVGEVTSQWRSPSNVSPRALAAVEGGGHLVGYERIWSFGSVAARPTRRMPVELEVGAVVVDATRLVVGQAYGEPRTVTLDLDAWGEAPQADTWPDGENNLGLDLTGVSPDGDVLAVQLTDDYVLSARDRSGRTRTLTAFHGGVDSRQVHVASDLADAPPVDFAAPAWAAGRPWWLVVPLVLTAAAVGVWGMRRWRTRRSTAPRAATSRARTPRLIGPVEAITSLALTAGLAVAVAPMVPTASGTEHPGGCCRRPFTARREHRRRGGRMP